MIWANIRQSILGYDATSPMIFNSGQFLFYFIIVLSVYAAIYRNNLSRTLFLIGFSLFFYFKSSGIFVLLLIFSMVAVYALTYLMHKQKEIKLKKLILSITICLALGLLFYYKYTNFFIETYCNISGTKFQALDIFLPIGISFYTFQLLSYAIDVYRNDIKPENNFLNYAFYISFFPQLVAGPIVRASLFLPQLKNKIHLSPDEINKGFFLIMIGLFKKAVLADYISQYNDLVFAAPETYSGFENLMAIYGYSLQIYCDFSGYSDIAIGIGKMMGFDLGINFNKPYQAKSISEFWRRWHISLSSWLRDYLYIPLGGNRKGKIRTYINLIITMLIGGLWHGASWKFVFWGGMHGIGLAIDKIRIKYIAPKFKKNIIGDIALWLVTFHFVVFLWIFFRASDFNTAWTMISMVFSSMDWNYLSVFVDVRLLFVALLIIGYAIHAIPSQSFTNVEKLYIKTPFAVKVIMFIVLFQIILQLKSESVQPFIYFQF